MKDFAYVPARTLGEAASALYEKGDRARVLAGGTDIIVQVREDRRDVDALVDVKAIPELNDLSYGASEGLTLVGELTTTVTILDNDQPVPGYDQGWRFSIGWRLDWRP